MKSYFLLFIAFASCASAQETSTTPDPPQPSSQIIFPIVPVIDQDQIPDENRPAPAPRPPNEPKFVSELSEDAWLVVESQSPIVVTSSPLGHVSVQPDEGPVKVKGKFADGTGKTETRTFTSKYLYFINAVKKGQVEILVFSPSTMLEEKDIPRFPLNVMGLDPRPGPGPEPSPNPGPSPFVPVSSFRVIFVKESGVTLNAEQMAIPGAKAIRDYLTAKTTPEGGLSGWREYDPQQNVANEQATMKALWSAVRPKITSVPAMVIEVNGNATVMPFPANASEALETLNKSGGQ